MIIRTYKPNEDFLAVNVYAHFSRLRTKILHEKVLKEWTPVEFADGTLVPFQYKPTVTLESIRNILTCELDKTKQRYIKNLIDWTTMTESQKWNHMTRTLLYNAPFKVVDFVLEENPEATIFDIAIEMLVQGRLQYSISEMGRILHWYFDLYPDGYFIFQRKNDVPDRTLVCVKPDDIF